MPNSLKKQNKVGSIGGGQLGLMLADAAVPLGYKPVILAENADAPAAQVHRDVIIGAVEDRCVLDSLFAQVDRVVFENEFVDCEKLEQAAGGAIQFLPGLDVMRKIQDKLEQKILLRDLEIPSARYRVLDLMGDISVQLAKCFQEFPLGCVLKWSRLGYDGKGVLVLNAHPEGLGVASSDDLSEVQRFCENAIRNRSSVYVEEKVAFQRELAVIGVFSIRGEFLSYPLVISEQKQGICYRVYGPAESFGVDSAQTVAAKNYAYRIAKALGLYGSFGMEFFETASGNLLVNEIAPRVHNTGHYTQDACDTSQFENHWRAVLGLKLGEIHFSPGFAMLNILGPDIEVCAPGYPLPELGSSSHLHWYGKKKMRARRKLGHLNAVFDSPEEVKQALTDLEGCYQHWVSRLVEAGKG